MRDPKSSDLQQLIFHMTLLQTKGPILQQRLCKNGYLITGPTGPTIYHRILSSQRCLPYKTLEWLLKDAVKAQLVMIPCGVMAHLSG